MIVDYRNGKRRLSWAIYRGNDKYSKALKVDVDGER